MDRDSHTVEKDKKGLGSALALRGAFRAAVCGARELGSEASLQIFGVWPRSRARRTSWSKRAGLGQSGLAFWVPGALGRGLSGVEGWLRVSRRDSAGGALGFV